LIESRTPVNIQVWLLASIGEGGYCPADTSFSYFIVDNVELPWIFPADRFDLIHTRIMNGSIADWPRLFERSFEYVSLAGTNILLCPSTVSDPGVGTASLAVGWSVKNWW